MLSKLVCANPVSYCSASVSLYPGRDDDLTIPPGKLLTLGIRPRGLEPPPHSCDSRLKRLNVPFWKRVPATTEFVARALSHWLYSYQAFECFFDIELVMDSLLSNRQSYCSSVLVNSVLYIACVFSIARSARFIFGN